MIALNPPLPGWIDDEAEHVLVLAMDRSAALCADETGHLRLRSLSSIQVDIRYQHDGDQWFINTLRLVDAEEETGARDGGVSFDLPETDDDGDRG